jgi:putative ABC transport system ATP-binding protein
MIELRDVRLSLDSGAGRVEILRGVDLSVPAGASVSVVGPSGSGKSSLLAIIGGIERASSGRVEVDGVDLVGLDEDDLAAFRLGRVGILFQSFHLVPTMDALENVALPLELARDGDAFAKAEAALDEVGLGHRLRHRPVQLSGGEQQRVAMARAMVAEPRLLLADEPTGNLDTATGAEIVELMFRLQRARGSTLVLVTHEAPLAARAEYRFAMRDGRLAPAEPHGLRVVPGRAQ